MQAARAGVQRGGGGAGRQAGRLHVALGQREVPPRGSGRAVCAGAGVVPERKSPRSASVGTRDSCLIRGLPSEAARVSCRGSRRRDTPASPRPIRELCRPACVVPSALKRDCARSSGAEATACPASAMMQLLGRFLVALALQTVCAQQQDKFVGNRTAEVGVISFHDVWNRSSCQPIEKLVDIVSEYPREVEHMFSPSCVSLRRCSGCCGDERLQCVPTQTANVTMQLLKMNSEEQAPYVELTFVEHRECVCRPRKGVPKLGRRRRRPKGCSKRKWARQKLKD